MKTSVKHDLCSNRFRHFTSLLSSALLLCLFSVAASANDRRFTYSYEPETMLQGAMEFEQWVTLRTQRGRAVGQENFNRWEIRSEFEYGVTDNYTVGLYLNTQATSFRDPTTALNHSKFEFAGVSIENRYMLLNPAEHAVGLTLYLEPSFSGDEAEIEQKIILGQRHGDWKWALNLIHATEWENNLRDTEGELSLTFGLARDLGSHWSLGVELRNVSALPEYREWEYSATYLGPVLSYRRERWWAALSVMPQIYGRNFQGETDGNRHLVLDEQERLNVRLLFGVSF
jgi:hypothetical protein